MALTLRLLGGLTTPEIARAFLAARADRGAAAGAGEADAARGPRRLRGAGAGASCGRGCPTCSRSSTWSSTRATRRAPASDWVRTELCEEALRLGRILAALAPAEPEAHGLIALLEIQASRIGARLGPDGEPVLLLDQDRSRWDPLLIVRGAGGAGARRRAARARSAPTACRRRSRPATPGRSDGRGHRLGADRGPLRAPSPQLSPSPDRRAEPRRRGRHGLRPRGRPRAARPDRRRARPARLPPPPQRPRRPARQARPPRRGRRRVPPRRRLTENARERELLLARNEWASR